MRCLPLYLLLAVIIAMVAKYVCFRHSISLSSSWFAPSSRRVSPSQKFASAYYFLIRLRSKIFFGNHLLSSHNKMSLLQNSSLNSAVSFSVLHCVSFHKKTELNSVALVREGTIPTERQPLVGELSANFCG
jgi:hypothetical protein